MIYSFITYEQNSRGKDDLDLQEYTENSRQRTYEYRDIKKN